MTLHRMLLPDFEEVVDMYYEFTKEVYPERTVGERYFFYKEVMQWINNRRDVILAKKDDTIVGFSLGYKDDNLGLTNPVYNGVIAYVKPEYRKTRAAYMLYKNISSLAEERGLTLMANGLVTNGVSNMIKKHFDCKEMFMNFERTYKGDTNENI